MSDVWRNVTAECDIRADGDLVHYTTVDGEPCTVEVLTLNVDEYRVRKVRVMLHAYGDVHAFIIEERQP